MTDESASIGALTDEQTTLVIAQQADMESQRLLTDAMTKIGEQKLRWTERIEEEAAQRPVLREIDGKSKPKMGAGGGANRKYAAQRLDDEPIVQEEAEPGRLAEAAWAIAVTCQGVAGVCMSLHGRSVGEGVADAAAAWAMGAAYWAVHTRCAMQLLRPCAALTSQSREGSTTCSYNSRAQHQARWSRTRRSVRRRCCDCDGGAERASVGGERGGLARRPRDERGGDGGRETWHK